MVKSYEDANQALMEMIDAKTVIKKHETILNKVITAARNKFEKNTSEAQKQIKRLEEDVADFCKLNKIDFEQVRSKKLTFGTIGYRKGTANLFCLKR
jgi:phage host-nuclease inhibitor protein Gam